MKKTFLLLFAFAMLFSACSDVFEHQLDIYKNAVDELDDVKSLSGLLDNAMKTECENAFAVASVTGEKWAELREKYDSGFEAMVDSVERVRSLYLRHVDALYSGFVMHFVEKRTLLYGKAAALVGDVKCVEEAEALAGFVKDFSAKAYVDGQRVCDPPAEVRDMYLSAKELFRQNYEESIVRLGGM